MTDTAQRVPTRPLRLWNTYSRSEAHDIFEPQTGFTPQTGTWGLQGIVSLKESPGDYVFFVTFDATQGTHSFVEQISEDGVLMWQSHPQQRLSHARIQAFIAHDDRVNTHRQVADRHPAVGQHHRQISQHPARRMRRALLPTTADRAIEHLRDTSRGGNISEQPRPDMAADTAPVRGDRDLRI